MLQCLNTAVQRPPREKSTRGELAHVRDLVQRILAGRQRPGRGGERRRDGRAPFPYLVRLAPLGPDGNARHEESIIVVGKYLSTGGIDFYHREPIAHRRMVASIDGVGGQFTTLLLELSWCRFKKQGWYDSGGRFLKVMDAAQTNQPADQREAS